MRLALNSYANDDLEGWNSHLNIMTASNISIVTTTILNTTLRNHFDSHHEIFDLH
jgi:hypothetical protein